MGSYVRSSILTLKNEADAVLAAQRHRGTRSTRGCAEEGVTFERFELRESNEILPELDKVLELHVHATMCKN